jgi:hypothetical protein
LVEDYAPPMSGLSLMNDLILLCYNGFGAADVSTEFFAYAALGVGTEGVDGDGRQDGSSKGSDQGCQQ